MKRIINQLETPNHNPLRRFSRTWLVMVLALLLSSLGYSTPTFAATPQAELAAPLNYSCVWYRIQGTNVYPQTVANKFGISLRSLVAANKIHPGRFLHRGDVLCIPVNRPPVPPPGPRPNPRPGPGPQPANGPWEAQYWNNPDQAGAPVLGRVDQAINFNWGFGTPDPSRIPADNFSARWTRAVQVTGGVYRFYVQHDDGARISIDGQVILDAYGYIGNRLDAVDYYIAPGWHTIVVDYVERTALAEVRFSYSLLYVGQPLPGEGIGNPSQPPPVVPGQPFPCSKPYLNDSNLCAEQPYPIRRGSSAGIVWRITTGFVSGEFDRGDGSGFRGPIYAEQRIVIENVTGPRTIRLRWTDGSRWYEDSLTLAVY